VRSSQPSADLSARLRTHSRGINDTNFASIIGSRPNATIMAATQPEAMEKYSKADKIMCF